MFCNRCKACAQITNIPFIKITPDMGDSLYLCAECYQRLVRELKEVVSRYVTDPLPYTVTLKTTESQVYTLAKVKNAIDLDTTTLTVSLIHQRKYHPDRHIYFGEIKHTLPDSKLKQNLISQVEDLILEISEIDNSCLPERKNWMLNLETLVTGVCLPFGSARHPNRDLFQYRHVYKYYTQLMKDPDLIFTAEHHDAISQTPHTLSFTLDSDTRVEHTIWLNNTTPNSYKLLDIGKRATIILAAITSCFRGGKFDYITYNAARDAIYNDGNGNPSRRNYAIAPEFADKTKPYIVRSSASDHELMYTLNTPVSTPDTDSHGCVIFRSFVISSIIGIYQSDWIERIERELLYLLQYEDGLIS